MSKTQNLLDLWQTLQGNLGITAQAVFGKTDVALAWQGDEGEGCGTGGRKTAKMTDNTEAGSL